eukprot:356761-Chlamydomonas_euryale.AAC.5
MAAMVLHLPPFLPVDHIQAQGPFRADRRCKFIALCEADFSQWQPLVAGLQTVGLPVGRQSAGQLHRFLFGAKRDDHIGGPVFLLLCGRSVWGSVAADLVVAAALVASAIGFQTPCVNCY